MIYCIIVHVQIYSLKLLVRLTPSILILLTTFIVCMNAYGQKIEIVGKIIDNDDGKPISAGTIKFKQSNLGTTSDMHGNFILTDNIVLDTLEISALGYQKKYLQFDPSSQQALTIKLNKTNYEINEVLVKPGLNVDPAVELFKKVLAQKNSISNTDKYYYYYQTYQKSILELVDPKAWFKRSIFLKPWDFIFTNTDTLNGNKFTPLFIVESAGEKMVSYDAERNVDFIQNAKISGFNNNSLPKLLAGLNQQINVTENQIILLNRSFASPLSDYGLINYNYYISDSTWIENNWSYQLTFNPKRKNELAFEGYLWVNDSSYTIASVFAKIPNGLNLNYINGLSFTQEYPYDIQKSALSKEQDISITLGLLPVSKLQPFKLRFNFSSNNYNGQIIEKLSDTIYSSNQKISISSDPFNLSDNEWNVIRKRKLSTYESAIYKNIDSIKNTTYFKLWKIGRAHV